MNPIILYDSRFLDGILTASSEATGYPVANIKDLRTYTFWKPAAAGTVYITIDCGSDKTADSLAIIGHNLKTANATVSVDSSPDNLIWTERLAGFIPSSDKAFLKTFTSAFTRYWRLKFITASVIPYIAVAMLGNKLQFPYPPDTPYIPYSETIETESSKSKAGHLLGTVVRFKPIEVSAKFSHLTRQWVIDSFKPFWDIYGSELKSFFWAWDIDTFPEHVFFLRMIESAKYEMPLSMLNYVDSLSLEMEGVKE